jgi:hypothetical protein
VIDITDTSERGEEVGKRCKRVNVVQNVHLNRNEKKIPVERIKENDGRGEFKYDIFDIL